MTVNSRVIRTFLAWSPDAIDVPLMNGLRVQILPTIEDLPRARKHQFAAFIASEALLVVWDDDASNLVARAKAIEFALMQLVWQTGDPDPLEVFDEKGSPRVPQYDVDSESRVMIPEQRQTNLLNTILVAFTLIIVTTLLGLGCRSLMVEVAIDHSYLRLAFLALVPVQMFFTLVCIRLSLIRDCSPKPVLLTSHRRLCCSVHWPSPTNATQLEILLGQMFASHPESSSSAHHSAMPCFQRRSFFSHCANSQVYQACHFNLRAARRLGEYIH